MTRTVNAVMGFLSSDMMIDVVLKVRVAAGMIRLAAMARKSGNMPSTIYWAEAVVGKIIVIGAARQEGRHDDVSSHVRDSRVRGCHRVGPAL